MRFVFRLQPMIAIAERDLKKAMATRNILVRNISQFEEDLKSALKSNLRQDRDLELAESGLDAAMFWHHREARHKDAEALVLRISEATELLADLDIRLAEIKTKIYRLEKSRETALTRFKLEQRRQEDKDFDEIATLRYRP